MSRRRAHAGRINDLVRRVEESAVIRFRYILTQRSYKLSGRKTSISLRPCGVSITTLTESSCQAMPSRRLPLADKIAYGSEQLR